MFISKLVAEQYHKVERPIIGCGKYELRPGYKSWEVAESKWFKMSSQQREQHLKRFNNEMLEESSCGSTISHTTTYPERMSLSVAVEEFAGDVRVPITCLEVQ